MLKIFWNSLVIIWADLWIRQNEFHWTNKSLFDEYKNSFFKKLSNMSGFHDSDRLVISWHSVAERKCVTRKTIAREIDDKKRPFRTFILRQWAWFTYLRT